LYGALDLAIVIKHKDVLSEATPEAAVKRRRPILGRFGKAVKPSELTFLFPSLH